MSNAEDYTPKPGSLAEKVIGYFRNNPGDALTIDEIKDTWSVKGNVVLHLERALASGWLTRAVHDLDIFMPGHHLRPTQAKPSPSLVSTPVKQRKGRGFSQLRELDIDTIKVDRDVPLPAGKTRKKHESKWAPLLAKLTAKGYSVTIPEAYRSTIDSYIRKLHKAKPGEPEQFKTGRDDQGAVRIWRVA